MDKSDGSMPEVQPGEIDKELTRPPSGGVLLRELKERDKIISKLKQENTRLRHELDREPEYLYRDTCERCWQVKQLLRYLAE